MENNGLTYLKEVAKYFMDFLETDFHKRKNPRRTVKQRNEDNLLIGIRLDKYQASTIPYGNPSNIPLAVKS
jgi:hypothetical protein